MGKGGGGRDVASVCVHLDGGRDVASVCVHMEGGWGDVASV